MECLIDAIRNKCRCLVRGSTMFLIFIKFMTFRNYYELLEAPFFPDMARIGLRSCNFTQHTFCVSNQIVTFDNNRCICEDECEHGKIRKFQHFNSEAVIKLTMFWNKLGIRSWRPVIGRLPKLLDFWNKFFFSNFT